jgi:hypothetical protein
LVHARRPRPRGPGYAPAWRLFPVAAFLPVLLAKIPRFSILTAESTLRDNPNF